MKWWIIPAVLLSSQSFAAEGSVMNAKKLCAMIDASGLSSQECEISGLGSSVTATFDMTPGEARSLCKKLSDHVYASGMRFGGWKLNIKSPYSGSNSIAFCKLL